MDRLPDSLKAGNLMDLKSIDGAEEMAVDLEEQNSLPWKWTVRTEKPRKGLHLFLILV